MTLDKFEHIKRQKWKSLFKENLIFVTKILKCITYRFFRNSTGLCTEKEIKNSPTS